MKFIKFLALIIVVVFGIWYYSSVSRPSQHLIEMSDNKFIPESLTIKKGDTVNFKNIGKADHWPASDIHPTHEIYSDFDRHKPIIPGQSWSFVFSNEGEWNFHDHLFPSINGVINVEP